ncbi:hypothetical protein AWENTII_007983 [Aspergillus wentii]
MSQHTVFRFPEQGSFQNLISSQEEVPTIAKHEVLVKIKAVALNSRDIQVATSKYPFPTKKDHIPCSDGAGDIVEVGSAVQGLEKGDRVISFDPTHLYGPQKDFYNGQGAFVDGTLAQYIARPASAVVKVPAGAPQSYSELASLVCTGVTAWNSLYGVVALKPGQTVLIQGEFTSIETRVIQMLMMTRYWVYPSQASSWLKQPVRRPSSPHPAKRNSRLSSPNSTQTTASTTANIQTGHPRHSNSPAEKASITSSK